MTAQPQTAKETTLSQVHRDLGAKIVPFAGHAMPLSYSGIVDEHHAVRQAAGLFDVSHMGQITVEGPQAAQLLDRMATNRVASLDDSHAVYTPLCFTNGGIVDDCVVYRRRADAFLVIVNAANRDKDHAWFCEHAESFDCTVQDISDECALMALQGPRALQIWAQVTGDTMVPDRFCFREQTVASVACTVARTGYTGEDGLEVLCPSGDAQQVWQALLASGDSLGLKPCGLGARDTLRLEARLLLYGNDIDQTTTPLEAGLGWTVKLKGRSFVGHEALRTQKQAGVSRRLVCLVMRSRGIARQGHRVVEPAGTKPVGHVTSGTKSPTLGQAIALAYVDKAQCSTGTRLAVDVRGRLVETEVVRGPFYVREQTT